ncbi:MAG: TIGR00269 family protein [Candidatus Micrarchaeia archaeon]
MKCSLCGSNAVIYLAYSDKFMCGKHLSRLVEKRVGNNIRKYGMVRGRSKIGIAISGGKDSLTMLYLMHKLIGADRRKKLVAISVDEGIQGYRDKSLIKAKELCNKLGVPHYVYSFTDFAVPMDKIMKHKRTDPCSYCGVFRRWVLNDAAHKLGLDALAIGHNLDDVVQTLLLNMMRNEPFRIARFTPNGGLLDDKEFVPRIRPMFNILEREVMVYALYNGIDFHNEECPYAGYALRNPIREFINSMEDKYPGTKFRMLNSYISLSNSIKIPKNIGIDRCKSCGKPSSTKLCKRCSFLQSLKDQM